VPDTFAGGPCRRLHRLHRLEKQTGPHLRGVDLAGMASRLENFAFRIFPLGLDALR